jgi:hypothetical protein
LTPEPPGLVQVSSALARLIDDPKPRISNRLPGRRWPHCWTRCTRYQHGAFAASLRSCAR